MANDININESAILEALNAKIDYDGGNYKGSGLANYVVDKTGDTITGLLRCRAGLDLQAPGITKGETPDKAAYWGIRFNDDTYANTAGTTWQQQRLGVMECALNTDSSVTMTLGAYQNVDASGGGARFTLKTSASGDQRCSFPICTAKATTTSSAATDKIAVVVQNYVNGTSWYRVWSDGWIEQGGVTPSGADQSTQTVTLLKAFANGNYNVVAIQRDGPAGNYTNGLRILSYTTKSFQINYRTGGTASAYWLACGY